MRAGRLNREVILQSPNPTRDTDDGAVIEGWTDVETVWAAVEFVGGKEILESGKLTSEVTNRIIIRHRSDVTPRWRVKMADTVSSPATNRFFRILTIENPGDGRRELRLMCQEMPDGEPA